MNLHKFVKYKNKFELAKLLKQNKLIIWDEAPITHKFWFEALDKSLKDIMSDDKYATSKKIVRKVVVFDGDFRRILHVIPRGSLFEIVHITINAL